MNTKKRTQDINQGNFRKRSPIFYLAPIAIAVGVAFMLYNRSSAGEIDAAIYRNAEECITANPSMLDTCNAAYESARVAAQKTAPKYASMEDCEAEFGLGACQANAVEATDNVPSGASPEYRQGSTFMPIMMGYMMGRMINGSYANTPMFSSASAGSPAYNKFVDATGRSYGNTNASNRGMKVDRSAFAPKPSTTTTITRGGFGQSVAKMSAAQNAKATNRNASSTSTRTFGG